MAYEIPGFAYSFMSTGDIRQFRAVSIEVAGATEIAAADAMIDGVAQMPADAAAPEVIRIMKNGITHAVAGGAVDVGDPVATDNQGRFVVTAVAADMRGKALTAAGAADEIITVLLY